MFKERLIKYKELDKEGKKLYQKKEDERRLIERLVEEYKKVHLEPIVKRKDEISDEMELIKDSIRRDMIDGLHSFAKLDLSQRLKVSATKLLIMFEEYAEIDRPYRSYISVSDVKPLMEYFLKIEDVDLCMRTLKSWHKMVYDYSYEQLADRYYTKIRDFSQADKSFDIDESEFKKWKKHVFMTPSIGAPQEAYMFKIIEMLGRLDARRIQSEEKIYYSEKTKRAIVYASIGGFSRITKEDGYTYLIYPKEWMEISMPWVERYRHCLMKVHDKAYEEEKQIKMIDEEKVL